MDRGTVEDGDKVQLVLELSQVAFFDGVVSWSSYMILFLKSILKNLYSKTLVLKLIL